MSLMEKFAKLTPEQREKFDSVKDENALVAFAAENGIELTEQDKKDALAYVENGVAPMSDDDMEAVAGGNAKKEESRKQAAADGRTIAVPIGNWQGGKGCCACNNDHKWARSKQKDGFRDGSWWNLYEDVKCYKCNNTWPSVSVRAGAVT